MVNSKFTLFLVKMKGYNALYCILLNIKANRCFSICQNKLFCIICNVKKVFTKRRQQQCNSNKKPLEGKTIQTRLELENNFDS